MADNTQSGMSKSQSAAIELRERLITSCAKLLSHERVLQQNRQVGIILSGGVDTGAILAACYQARQRNPALPAVTQAVTVVSSRHAPDFEFSSRLAEEYQLAHTIVYSNPERLLEDCLISTIKTLRSFDPMTVRNSLVIERALIQAQEFSSVGLWLTGDAADELFGGYSFTWKNEEPTWSESRRKMCMSMAFTTDSLALAHGLLVQSPFRDPSLVEWALQSCPREVCLGERELVQKITDHPQKVFTGKVNLRDSFPENSSTNRKKDTIEIGSGSTQLSHPGFFASLITETEEAIIRKHAKAVNIELTTLEHVKYFEVFHSLFLVNPT